MRISKYRLYKAAIGGMLGIAVGIAITTNTPLIAVAAVVVAIIVAIVLERSNKEIVRDERVSQISWRSAAASFNVIVILAAIATLVIALLHNRLPENVVFFGSIMGYLICFALLLNICFYAYFSRKQ
jgi:uncharacterized membrane protein